MGYSARIIAKTGIAKNAGGGDREWWQRKLICPLAIIPHRTETCPTQIADAQVCQCEAAGAGPDSRPFDDSSFLSRQGGVQF